MTLSPVVAIAHTITSTQTWPLVPSSVVSRWWPTQPEDDEPDHHTAACRRTGASLMRPSGR